MADPVDLPELRRLAEAHAGEHSTGTAYWPRQVLALLDRIDALEAGLEQVGWVKPNGRLFKMHSDPVTHARETADPEWTPVYRLADPGAVAGEPESEGTP